MNTTQTNRVNKANGAKLSKLNGATKPQAETVHASDESSTGERIYQRYNEARDEFMKFLGAPGWKRTLVALLSAGLIGAGIGWIGGTILGWMVAGAILLQANMFLVICTYVLGLIITVITGSKVAGRVCGAILTGEADERAIAAYDATKNALAKLNPMRLFGTKTAATVH